MPEAATAPPPRAPTRIPLLTPESFEGLVNVVEALAAMADMLGEANRIPVEPELEQRLRAAGAILVAVERQHENLSDNALGAWAARASMLAVVSANLAAKILAELTDRHAARQAAGAIVAPDGVTPAAAAVAEQSVIVGPDLRPAAPPRPTLPPHLQAVVAAHHAPRGFEMPGFMHVERVGDLVRVTCDTCGIALGDVGADIAQIVIDTHEHERHPAPAGGEQVAWLHPKVPDPGPGPYDVPTCRRCWCTDANGCLQTAGPHEHAAVGTCSWAELNPETNAGVCSACAEGPCATSA